MAVERLDHTVVLPGFRVANERAVAPCGCCIWCGYDGPEPFIGAEACQDVHIPMMGLAIERYRRSLDQPQARLAVEVADEILQASVPPWNDPRVEWRCEEHPDVPFEECCGGAGVPYLNGEPYDG